MLANAFSAFINIQIGPYILSFGEQLFGNYYASYYRYYVEYIMSLLNSNEGAENNLFLVNEVPMTLSTSLTKQINFIEIPPTHIW